MFVYAKVGGRMTTEFMVMISVATFSTLAWTFGVHLGGWWSE